jgi:pimeloyl-ACP methyl ester carboxylesterase
MPPMPQATPKVLVLIHGLCMNDLQWQSQANHGSMGGHAAALSQALGYTPVYVRYNTGLHTSENGALLAQQLQQLVQHWPVPVEEIAVVAHSMGGLVTRSAVHCAQSALPVHPQWLDLLKNIIFLGTPHHGAPLERAGNWVDVVLGSTPFTKPFAKLGQLRSAGITDLRYGHVVDADWKGHDRFRRKPDSRTHIPLPEGVACFAVAATLAGARSPIAERLVGDGLVPLGSALGRHDVAGNNLVFAKSSQWVVYRTNHMELLRSPQVTQKMLDWLRPAP